MGSGRGKNRRAAALIVTRQDQVLFGQGLLKNPVVYDPAAWQDFVRESELGSVPIAEYYLGRNAQHYTGPEHEKVMDELFADAVAVGAITLPPSYKAQSFTFAVAGGDTRSE